MCLLKGVTNVLIPRFDPAAVIQAIQKHKVTVFAGVPTMYWGLLNFKTNDFDVEEAMSSLRTCSSGGASLPVQVLRDFEARFDVKILEGYGMSEGSPVVTFNHLDRETKVGSVGQALWGIEVMVADENGQEVPVGEKGELLYRGHNVMKGYYKRPDASAETIKDGWLHSGDIAIMDSDRYFYIVDRTKDMVIRGGFNVYPREVEEVMMQHPAVSMVAVIGIPDEQYGEEIKACVVLKEGESITASALIAWTKERLAMYKYPRHVEFMTSLPMNASGKILKMALRKQ
jgi:long-chain acyl-CoA synthetase